MHVMPTQKYVSYSKRNTMKQNSKKHQLTTDTDIDLK